MPWNVILPGGALAILAAAWLSHGDVNHQASAPCLKSVSHRRTPSQCSSHASKTSGSHRTSCRFRSRMPSPIPNRTAAPTRTAVATARSSGFAYHPGMLVELLRLVLWLAVVITVVSLIALLLTQGKL